MSCSRTQHECRHWGQTPGHLESCSLHMSRLMRKPTLFIYENKDADQLRSKCEAEQRLCFRYKDSTIIFLPLVIFCACTSRFVPDLFGNHIIGFPMNMLAEPKVRNTIHPGVRLLPQSSAAYTYMYAKEKKKSTFLYI